MVRIEDRHQKRCKQRLLQSVSWDWAEPGQTNTSWLKRPHPTAECHILKPCLEMDEKCREIERIVTCIGIVLTQAERRRITDNVDRSHFLSAQEIALFAEKRDIRPMLLPSQTHRRPAEHDLSINSFPASAWHPPVFTSSPSSRRGDCQPALAFGSCTVYNGQHRPSHASSRALVSSRTERTLDILKSLRIPRPFPPRIHRFRICVGLV